MWVNNILAVVIINDEFNQLVQLLKIEYKVKDISQPSNFIRMAIKWDRKTKILPLSQSHYIKTLLSRFNLKGIYKYTISMDPHANLAKFDGKATINKKKIYSSAVGDIN